jgi:small nuclear ribonucleoprotein (snRNP)-like protein
VEPADSRPDPVPLGAAAGVLGGDALAARLERWAADARVDEAARLRSRERWLRRQAEESSTVAGVLADLLEAARPVVVHTRSGRRHQGVVRALGADFVAVGAAQGTVLVALAAVASLRGAPGEGSVLGDREVAAARVHLADVAAGLAAERARVLLVTTDGEALAGVLSSVGRDVALLRGTGDPPTTCYVPLAAVCELVIDG